jgi:hypothetical protein
MKPEWMSGSLVPTRPTTAPSSEVGWYAHRSSRGQFLRTAAGAAAIGAGLLLPGRAAAGGPGIGLVEPIPWTLEFFPGVQSHVLAPPAFEGPDSDPATVYNFEGVSALAYISGECEQRNRTTGETRVLPYQFNDMRFMKGVFRGHDGHVRDASFGFI